MAKPTFSLKRRIGIFALILAFAGIAVLGLGYIENIVGTADFRTDLLRLLSILMIAAFAAMGGVSLSRFDDRDHHTHR